MFAEQHGRCGNSSAATNAYRSRGSEIATQTAVELRLLIVLLLISGGLIFTLTALVERPDESHGHAEAAASTSGHETNDHAPAVAAAETDDHGAASEASTGETEVYGTVSEASADESAERIGASASTAGSESDHSEDGHEEQTRSVLGVDRESLNLAYPWLTTIFVALMILLVAAFAIRQGVGLLAATVVIGLAGVAVGIAEAFHAGEELGIFVPLPILASVLHGGAASIAGLALIATRNEPEATHPH